MATTFPKVHPAMGLFTTSSSTVLRVAPCFAIQMRLS